MNIDNFSHHLNSICNKDLFLTRVFSGHSLKSKPGQESRLPATCPGSPRCPGTSAPPGKWAFFPGFVEGLRRRWSSGKGGGGEEQRGWKLNKKMMAP